MTPNDLAVLSALKFFYDTDSDFCYVPFRSLSGRTSLDRRQVRLSVRRLARKGYAEFCRGLWSVDGEPAGSGYAITPEGRKALKS